ncbi:MAG: dynamin family protein [Deltaproteobacteria bacterium]|nr:dynamin family protein [Deltaproteobacteria bacterium]
MGLWSRFQRRLGDLAGELVLDDYRDQLSHAEGLVRGGDVSSAIDMLEALLTAKPDHGQALILLGEAHLTLRNPEKAREAFERANAVRSGDPSALVGHGLALVMLGRYEAALAPLSRAVADSSGDRGLLAEAYRGLGVAWRRLGDLDKAIRELRKAVTEDAEDLEARASLGEALISDGGSIDEAVRHLERAASTDAPPALALYGLGRVALLEGSPAVASEMLAKARIFAEIDATPLGAHRRQDIVIAQGDAALASRDAAKAHSFYLEALQHEPRSPALHAKIATAHRAIGNLDAALGSFDRALALGADVDVLRAAVDTAIAARDTTRCLQWGGDLLGKEPENVRALVARGNAMLDGQPEAARALLEVAAARDDVDAHVALARLALPNDAQSAASSARAALRADPHHAQARQLLTDARAATYGEPGADIADLAKFVEKAVESRRELGHLVGEVARAAAALDQPLLVTVMGEFSSGKSSFVNAFIGADVAPTGITPTTATINVVRYGRERGGRTVSREGVTTEYTWDALMAHLKVLTPDAAKAIDRVEILLPLPQLEKINIVDTPGLNSIQPEHEATARAFIARADAVVWVFTASQGGKASEKKALRTIHEEGKRVLGVLNKADQLSEAETTEVVSFIGGELGELVEAIVPFSARDALAWKRAGSGRSDERTTEHARSDGNWGALASSLEQRFFQQARQLKRDACVRTLRTVVGEAQGLVDTARTRAATAGDAARAARDQLSAAAATFADEVVLAERKALSDHTATLYRRAAREVIDLVRPRRLPFSSHKATLADRDYLIALLQSGLDVAIEGGRRRVASDLLARSRALEPAARTLGQALGADVIGDLQRAADDRIGLALSRVFDRARAYLRGYLEGGYVEGFFRSDVPNLDLSEDAVYHALVKNAPDLDHELGDPLTRAAADALATLANRLDHWSAVVDVQGFDLEVGVGRALEIAAARCQA